MKRFILLLSLLVPSSAFGNQLFFPQVVYGGGYITTITIMNTGTTNVTQGISFYTQAGANAFVTNPLNIPIGGSTRFVVNQPSSQVNVIWGAFDAGNGSVQGLATYDLRSGNGNLTTTVGMVASPRSNGFLLPVDVTATSSTGVAIANVSGLAPFQVTLSLYTQDGSLVGTSTDRRFTSLVQGFQVSAFVDELFPQLKGTTFSGTLSVAADSRAPANGVLAAAGLTFKEGLFSAVPVVSFTPSGTTNPGSISIAFFPVFQGSGSVRFQNQTFTSTLLDGYVFNNVAPGTYQVTGTVGPLSDVGVLFSNLLLSSPGGVAYSSLQSLQGPNPLVTSCTIQYVSAGSSSQSFTFQFTVTSSRTSAC